MTIFNSAPFNLQNGNTADATQVMSNFNQIINDGNSNAAHNGNNSDITQLSGLTTAISVGQGGTGATAAGATLLANIGLVPFMRGYIGGLTLSNDGGSPNSIIDISAGVCVNSTNASLIQLGAFTKSTAGAWAAGSAANGMGTGLTVAQNTWYHVFAIINSGAADAYFDTSITAANAPAGTTAFRRIGSFKTASASTNILAFTQFGEEFLWAVPVQDFSTATLTNTVTAVTLASTPPGIQTLAILNFDGSNAGAYKVLLYGGDLSTNQAVDTPVGNATTSSVNASAQYGTARIRTDTSQHINAIATGANTTLNIVTTGYVDYRGRYA